jgi:WhiB family redox-sensing transcriptional regulator
MAAYPNFLTDRTRGCSPENGVNPDIFHANPKATAVTDMAKTGKAVQQRAQARQVCRACPFTQACFTWAEQTSERAGIWGGVDMGSEREREKARALYGIKAETVKCTPDLPLIDRILKTKTVRFADLDTDDQVAVIRAGITRGMHLGVLANRFNSTYLALKQLLGEDMPTFDRQVRELYDADKSDAAIALALRCSTTTVATSRKRQGLPTVFGSGGRRINTLTVTAQTYTPEQLDQQVRTLYNQDLSDRAIADQLGVPIQRVLRTRLHRLGLPTKFSGKRLVTT